MPGHPSGPSPELDMAVPESAPRSRSTSLADHSVCLLGPEIEHRDSLAAMLEGRARSVHWVCDSHTFLRREQRSRGRLDRGLDAIVGTRDPRYLAHLLAEIDASGASLVVGYWGTLPLGDLIALKRARPQVRCVAVMLCYPLSLESWGIFRQASALRRAAASLDGVICPTEHMADYIRSRVLRGRTMEYGIVAPCWPQRFQAGTRPAPVAERPNLVYVGRTDLSGATVHKADDLRPLMHAILDAGIELHHVYSKETADDHPLRRTFAPRTIDQLIATMPAHDASLIAYNLDACQRTDRFELTVPDRLLSSVAAGVPVAIPRVGYAASKRYLRDYGAMIEFDSPAALAAALADRAAVRTLHDTAWAARSRYTAEAQGASLASFLERVAAA
jgi:hypothetical protein